MIMSNKSNETCLKEVLGEIAHFCIKDLLNKPCPGINCPGHKARFMLETLYGAKETVRLMNSAKKRIDSTKSNQLDSTVKISTQE
jgi:hypothetical protein